MPRVEVDDKIELSQIFGPTGLATGKDLGSGEVLKALMICDHVNRDTGTFEVVLPNTEGLKDSKEFLVMSVIIELRCRKGSGVEGHRVDLTRVGLNGEDRTKGIVRGISLNNNGFVGDPMSEDWGRGEGGLKGLERLSSGIGEIPRDALAGEPSKRNINVGIVQDGRRNGTCLDEHRDH